MANAWKDIKALEGKDAYSILGVERGASGDEIKSAYRKKAMENHPDRTADLAPEARTAAEQRFKDAQKAYDVLGDSDARKTYDSIKERPTNRSRPPGEKASHSNKESPNQSRSADHRQTQPNESPHQSSKGSGNSRSWAPNDPHAAGPKAAPKAPGNAPAPKTKFGTRLGKAGGALGAIISGAQLSKEGYDIINSDASTAEKAEALTGMTVGFGADVGANVYTLGMAGGAASTVALGYKEVLKESYLIALEDKKLTDDLAAGKITSAQYTAGVEALDARTQAVSEQSKQIKWDALAATTPGFIATGSVEIATGTYETLATYAAEDKRFQERSDFRHLNSMQYRLADGIKAHGGTFDEKGKLDLSDEKNRNAMRAAISDKQSSLGGTIADNQTWAWWGEKLDRYKNAQSELAIVNAAEAELGNYEKGLKEQRASRPTPTTKKDTGMDTPNETQKEAPAANAAPGKPAEAPAPAQDGKAPQAPSAPAPAAPAAAAAGAAAGAAAAQTPEAGEAAPAGSGGEEEENGVGKFLNRNKFGMGGALLGLLIGGLIGGPIGALIGLLLMGGMGMGLDNAQANHQSQQERSSGLPQAGEKQKNGLVNKQELQKLKDGETLSISAVARGEDDGHGMRPAKKDESVNYHVDKHGQVQAVSYTGKDGVEGEKVPLETPIQLKEHKGNYVMPNYHEPRVFALQERAEEAYDKSSQQDKTKALAQAAGERALGAAAEAGTSGQLSASAARATQPQPEQVAQR